ncbi:MAG: flap endonuclease-1 [Candidatus Anstonellales archaeon]
MGVDISSVITPRQISFLDLNGKKVGIDAFNTLYQFLSSIRQEDGTPLQDMKGNVTSHLAGILYRTARFFEFGVLPVYVFDGEKTPFKIKEIERRAEQKRLAEERLRKAIEEERVEEVGRYAKAVIKLDKQKISESKELISSLGIPVVTAMFEGEAEAASMASKGLIDGVASQDYDALVFGAPVLYRNLTLNERRRVGGREITVRPEMLIQSEVLKQLGITKEKLVWLALLIGTDFNQGITGVGAKKGLALVKSVQSFNELKTIVAEKYKQEFEDYIDEVAEFFLNPPVHSDYSIKWSKPDKGKVFSILCKEHDFSEERVAKVLERMESAYEKRIMQRRIDSWF